MMSNKTGITIKHNSPVARKIAAVDRSAYLKLLEANRTNRAIVYIGKRKG